MTLHRTLQPIILALVLVVLLPGTAFAHCDGLDGPVVKAAQKALETRNVNLVLIWVQPADEQEIRTAFTQTLAVRELNAQARALADRFFFETLVRIHRTGEGAAYTGLKPAGRDLGPAIPAADRALETGSPDALIKLLMSAAEHGIHAHFAEAKEAKAYRPEDLAAGRKYVQAYVEFIHYVERLHEAIATAAHGHAGGAER